jgi:D-glycero-D-manno-heptose 1,7-bisphosphate phosphatase
VSGRGRRPTAAYIDRDGTLMRDTGYVARSAEVELLPRAADAVRLLNDEGVPVVIVTNQSGIGRGYFDESAFHAVQARLVQLLEMEGARIEATYFCPHAPEDGCDCRKPGLALYRKAALELGLQSSGGLFAGDRVQDVLPALELGGTGILVAGMDGTYDGPVPARVIRATDLWTGVSGLLLGAGNSP